MRLLTKNLEIGTFIKEQIEPICPTYPVIADQGANGNYCVYRRTGFTARNTKDIYDYESTASIEIIVVAQSYKESIRLAQDIKDKLEGFHGHWNHTVITSIFLENTNEDWNSDCYLQRLYFTINVDDDPANRRHHHKPNPEEDNKQI